MRTTTTAIAILTCLFATTYCGKDSSRLEGWWLTKSALVEGQRVDLAKSEAAYMAGFNDGFQGYAIHASDKCNGTTQKFSAKNGKIVVEASGDCPERSAK